MKRSLGISIYPEHSTVEKDKAYLKLASEYGFTRVFTCLLSVVRDRTNRRLLWPPVRGVLSSRILS